MPLIEEDIVSALSGIQTYPLSVPTDGTYPNAVYQRISTNQKRHMTGNGLERIRFQITCWGKTYASSLATANTVKGILDLNTTQFELVTKENQFDTKQAESGNYSTVLEFFVWDK